MNTRPISALLCAAVMMTLSSCAGADRSTPVELPAFDKTALGEEVSLEFMAVNAYIYEAVPLDGKFDPAYEGTNARIQLDVRALENELGYIPGEWVPYLTLDYDVTDADNKSVAVGALRPCATKSGPAYGANIALEKGGTYNLRVTFHDPRENGYVLQTDSRTGVSGTFWDTPVNATWNGWVYE